MVFMAEAVLLTKGLSSFSRKSVISLFGKHFVKTRIFERSLGRAPNEAYDKRVVGDYGVGFRVSKEEAKDLLLDISQNFIHELKDYLKMWTKTGEG